MGIDEICRCPLHEPDRRRDDWDQSARQIVEDVAGFGWHVVMVFDPDRSTAAWAYTVGLGHTFGVPDLVMVGLDPDGMHVWLNKAVEVIKDGRKLADDSQLDDVLGRYTLLVRDVVPGWEASLFGFARWFSRSPTPPMQQLVWPDDKHLMPWDEGASEGCRMRQARLWLAPEEQLNDAWTGCTNGML